MVLIGKDNILLDTVTIQASFKDHFFSRMSFLFPSERDSLNWETLQFPSPSNKKRSIQSRQSDSTVVSFSPPDPSAVQHSCSLIGQKDLESDERDTDPGQTPSLADTQVCGLRVGGEIDFLSHTLNTNTLVLQSSLLDPSGSSVLPLTPGRSPFTEHHSSPSVWSFLALLFSNENQRASQAGPSAAVYLVTLLVW